jgi:hypothetical protein
MANPRTGNIVVQDSESEHIGPDYTGDNISAKKVANYVWNGSTWERQAPSSGSIYITVLRANAADPDITYIGKAVPGTATSSAAWQIARLDENTNLDLLYADSGAFTQVYDNREALTYA